MSAHAHTQSECLIKPVLCVSLTKLMWTVNLMEKFLLMNSCHHLPSHCIFEPLSKDIHCVITNDLYLEISCTLLTLLHIVPWLIPDNVFPVVQSAEVLLSAKKGADFLADHQHEIVGDPFAKAIVTYALFVTGKTAVTQKAIRQLRNMNKTGRSFFFHF